MIVLPSRFQNATTRQADLTQDMQDLASVVSQLNQGLAPALISVLDASNNVASVAVPTTPTVLTVPTVNVMMNIGFNTSTGILTFLQSGTYQFVFELNVFDASTTTIFFGAEIDTGSGTFVSIPLSGRQENINVNIAGQVLFVSLNFFPAGARARVYAWASNSTATYQTTALTSLPGGAISVPAVRILITGQSSS
jgi:hypothetical protein